MQVGSRFPEQRRISSFGLEDARCLNPNTVHQFVNINHPKYRESHGRNLRLAWNWVLCGYCGYVTQLSLVCSTHSSKSLLSLTLLLRKELSNPKPWVLPHPVAVHIRGPIKGSVYIYTIIIIQLLLRGDSTQPKP